MTKRSLLMSASAVFLLSSFSVHSQIITVNYTGTVTDLGVDLQGDGVVIGSNVVGAFSYDTSTAGPLNSFDISVGGGFSASLSGTGSLSVQNDQMNGSATLPADGMTAFGSSTSNTLNGHANPDMQFGLLRENQISQLWNDTLPPDLADWANITLADINEPDWHWMDFNLPISSNGSFRDDQIRWEVNAFQVSAVPVPAAVWLFGSGLLGLLAVARRKALT